MSIEDFPEKIEVKFFNKGASAGKASGTLNNNYVMYNTSLMSLEDGWKHISSRTIAHEVAHRIDCIVHKGYRSKNGRRKIRDSVWRAIMQEVLGVKASRCHSIKIPNKLRKRQKRFKAVASCGCEFSITPTTANKMKKGIRYSCAEHGRVLSLV